MSDDHIDPPGIMMQAELARNLLVPDVRWIIRLGLEAERCGRRQPMRKLAKGVVGLVGLLALLVGVGVRGQWWDENREPITDRFNRWLLG
jgi:hypothetical protein